MLLIAWYVVVMGLVVWFVARLIGGNSFIATRFLLISMPVLLGLLLQSWWFALFGLLLGAIYLSTQEPSTDDHLIIKERWPNLWAFLTGPKRN
jgi:hypothetical protein